MHYWTPQEDEALLSLAMPAAETAERMSAQFRRVITKNMVIGRRSRLREGGGEPRPPREPTPRKHIARTPWHPKLTAAATVVEAEATAVAPRLAVVSAEPSEPVRFLERRQFQCAWILDENVPIAERMCCGAPTVRGGSWCQTHRLRCFDIAATRKAFVRARTKGLAA